MNELFEIVFVNNPVFGFLFVTLTEYPVFVILAGVLVSLFGYDMLRKSRRDPAGQVQPAAATMVVGVLIALSSPVMLLISNAGAA